jgi:hypothetical protein
MTGRQFITTATGKTGFETQYKGEKYQDYYIFHYDD